MAKCHVTGLGFPAPPPLTNQVWGQVQRTLGHRDSQLSLDTADSRALFRTSARGGEV